MTEILRHRGPDSGGLWIDGSTGFGHRRLSIIDLSSAAHQPMLTDDEQVCLTYNGEIYNFQALRRVLERKGHSFSSTSDTEVLLRMYLEFGIEMVRQLRGMFAFGLWDKRKGTLFLCRDRLGIKPLLYSTTPDGLYFASEMQSLMLIPSNSPNMDETALADFLAFGYLPGSKTLRAHIRRLPPAHILEFRPDSSHPHILTRYWTLSDVSTVEQPGSFDDVVEAVRAKVNESVKLRLVSDAPIGSFLSGGVDSSLVSASMATFSPEPISTFCIGFEDSAADERRYARQLARRYHTKHSEEVIRPDALNALEAMPALRSDPIADNSIVPTYFVSKMARRAITVALSGDGGDEAFAGYNRYSRMRATSILDIIPSVLRTRLFSALGHFWPSHMKGKGWLSRAADDFITRYLNMMAVFPNETWRTVLSPDLRKNLTSYDPYQQYRDIYRDLPGSPLERLLRLDIETYLPSDILHKVDIASMSVSLETRVPLLDHELLELAFTIPIEMRMKNGERKAVLKAASSDLVPPELLGPRKQGFVMPIGKWFRGPLANSFCSTTDGSTRQCEILDECGLQNLVSAHHRGSRDYGRRLWSLLILQRSLVKTF